MSQFNRNSNREALLVGRIFEFRVPHPVEACVARLEKQAASEAKFAVRFSKVKEGLYEFELLFGGFLVSEVVGRGRLEDIGDGHTLVTGHIGQTSVTNIIIAVWVIGGLLFLWWVWSVNGGFWYLVFAASVVVYGLYQPLGRLRVFDRWLHWVQEALAFNSPSGP